MILIMAPARKRYDAEPTLYDVIEAMQGGFTRIEQKLEEHDSRFDQIKEDFREVNRPLFNLELSQEDIRDVLTNHEERIARLEGTLP